MWAPLRKLFAPPGVLICLRTWSPMTSWPRLETIQQQLKTFTNKHLARWEPFEAMSSTNRGSTGQAMA